MRTDRSETGSLRLRDVTLGDLDLYVAMRCDPDMMAELGGPLPRDGVPDKLRRDVATVDRDDGWIKVIESGDGRPMGSVVLWTVDDEGDPYSEIGWMVLPAFQGRGIGKAAAGALIELAHVDGRWGAIHAHPGVANAASNGICRSLGFTLVGQVDVVFEDRTLATNHWRLDPSGGGA